MKIADLVRLLYSNISWLSLSSLLFQIQKGVSSARSDDTKSLKGIILDWITPRDVPLNPPLSRNVKTNHGFHHNATGHFSVLLAWIGMILSKYRRLLNYVALAPLTFKPEYERNLPVVQWQSLVISGQCWCMRTRSTTLTTHGMDFSGARFSFGWVISVVVCPHCLLHHS